MKCTLNQAINCFVYKRNDKKNVPEPHWTINRLFINEAVMPAVKNDACN